MKRKTKIITTIIVLVLAALGGTSAYIKYLSIEFKNETNLNNKTTVYVNEVNINEEMAENISVQNNSVIDKNDKASKDYIKGVKKNTAANPGTNTDNETTIGRIEIPKLNIKTDLLSSQMKYTSAGLNQAGNSVIYLENAEYEEITEGTQIYIRNAEQEKMIYTVYNIYESTSTDTSFYESNTSQIELTLVINQEDAILVIQARQE